MMKLPDIEPKGKETNAIPVAEKKVLPGILNAAQVTAKLEKILGNEVTGEEVRKARLRRLNAAISALQGLGDNDVAGDEIINGVRCLIMDLERTRAWMYKDMVDWDKLARSDKA